MFGASERAKPFGSHNRAQTFGERVGTRVLRAHEIGAQTPSIGTLEVHRGNVTPQGCAQQFLRPGPHELRRVALECQFEHLAIEEGEGMGRDYVSTGLHDAAAMGRDGSSDTKRVAT